MTVASALSNVAPSRSVTQYAIRPRSRRNQRNREDDSAATEHTLCPKPALLVPELNSYRHRDSIRRALEDDRVEAVAPRGEEHHQTCPRKLELARAVGRAASLFEHGPMMGVRTKVRRQSRSRVIVLPLFDLEAESHGVVELEVGPPEGGVVEGLATKSRPCLFGPMRPSTPRRPDRRSASRAASPRERLHRPA